MNKPPPVALIEEFSERVNELGDLYPEYRGVIENFITTVPMRAIELLFEGRATFVCAPKSQSIAIITRLLPLTNDEKPTTIGI